MIVFAAIELDSTEQVFWFHLESTSGFNCFCAQLVVGASSWLSFSLHLLSFSERLAHGFFTLAHLGQNSKLARVQAAGP
jgi:hypothetical protein